MSEQKFEAWAIVELFGHQRVAGRITEQAIGGETFIRVDIPKGEGFFTRLFGKGAIYAINVTDEAAARLAATQFGSRPAYAWELEQAQRLPAPHRNDDADPELEEDDIPL